MAEKFKFEVQVADESRLLPLEKQKEWTMQIPFHEGELTLLGSNHEFVNNPDAISSLYTAACFETFQSDVLDLYLAREMKEYPEFELHPKFSLSVPTVLNEFAEGQYRLILKKLIDNKTKFYFATDTGGGSIQKNVKEDRDKALAILAAPPAVATLTAAVNKFRGEALMSRRNFLLGAGALALSSFVFSELVKDLADPKDAWLFPQFANKVREIVMSLKVEYVYDLMKQRGKEEPKILFAVGAGHVSSLKYLFSVPRKERVAYVMRVIEVLRTDYGEAGKIIASEFEKTATVPEMVVDVDGSDLLKSTLETHLLVTNPDLSYTQK